jgi:hypothetical protein
VIADGGQGAHLGCSVLTLAKGIRRALPDRMKKRYDFQEFQLEFGLMKCFESKHFSEGRSI